MLWQVQRPEDIRQDRLPVGGQRLHQPAIGRGVTAQAIGGGLHRAFDDDRVAIRQRVCERSIGMYPPQPKICEG